MTRLTHLPGVSNEEYHKLNAESPSRLKTIGHCRPDGGWRGGSPYHYYCAHRHPHRPLKAQTASQIKGSALHIALFEPDRYKDLVAVVPPSAPARPTKSQLNAEKPSPKAKDAIQWWKDFEAQSQRKFIISNDTSCEVQAMAASARRHSGANHLINLPGIVEGSYIFDDKQTNLPCKLRPDKHTSDFVIDAKGTSKSVSRDDFQREIYNWDYHVQAAWNIDHLSASMFLWVVIEFDWPHSVAVYPASDECLAAGRRRYRTALDTIAQCCSTGIWPGPEGNLIAEPISLPGWCDD
jgi:exodeoxyribonuclease VIII